MKTEMKNKLKEMAAQIRADRNEIAKLQKNGEYAGNIQWPLPGKIEEYRWHHIAYSLARGKTYKQIENKVKDGNKPDWGRIDNILCHQLAYVLFEDKTAKPIYPNGEQS